ncbi:hypothetical protein H6P81_005822 [Aristolochia fimbriata]|uniref:Bms1-type G domain-containing protein n=1 Tax=Aristolochia fimbriata TaxID=158543 RepID=A0AAV7EVR1_ARIFI|nr:hypothetical protein H6P81_005822 [Aristolochia fimbriata]
MVGSRFQVNKAHKSRNASKSSGDIHRTSGADKTRIAKSNNVIKGSRTARIEWSKMMRDQKLAAVLKEKGATGGSSSPPCVIVLFGLSASVNVKALAQNLLMVLSPEGAVQKFNTVASPNYKLRTTVLEAPYGDLLSCMEMAKVADLIAFVASASAIHDDDYIDEFGNHCLSVFRALGLPNTAVLMRDLPVDMKKRHDLKKSCTLSLASHFPEDCKFYPVDTKEELHKFIWPFKVQRLSVPHWRSQRPYLMAHEFHLVAGDSGERNCMLLLSGAGDFQLSKIDVLRDPFPINIRKNQDLMDAEAVLEAQESLPLDYARTFAFDNFSRTQKHVIAKALEPVVACGLLQHESRMSVLHFSIKKHNSYETPIKSKEALIFNVGFRRFSVRPIFSTDNINSDKHKMERPYHAEKNHSNWLPTKSVEIESYSSVYVSQPRRREMVQASGSVDKMWSSWLSEGTCWNTWGYEMCL